MVILAKVHKLMFHNERKLFLGVFNAYVEKAVFIFAGDDGMTEKQPCRPGQNQIAEENLHEGEPENACNSLWLAGRDATCKCSKG